MGPGRSVPCKACGGLVSVHKVSILSFIPLFACFIAVRNLWPSPSSFVLLAAAALLAGFVQVFMIPLVTRPD